MIGTERQLYYPLSLILSTGKKSSEELAKTVNRSGYTVLRILDNECISWEQLVNTAKSYFRSDKVEVIIDDTIIGKMYSKYIAGSGDNYDLVTGQIFRSIYSVAAIISDGKLALPVAHRLWVKEELCSQGTYRTKFEIAQELIEQLMGKINIKIALMDGLYATSGMIAWCNKNQIPFEMRSHSNRRISLDQEKPDVIVKINESEKLRLRG